MFPSLRKRLVDKSCVGSLLVLLLLSAAARTQEGHYLALRGPGTASVFWLQGHHTAYITDGGKGTTLIDPQEPKEAEATILGFLRKEGVRNLVVTCSHPHADHRDGLVRMIRNDPTLFQFERIFFVESDYPVEESLAQIYERTLQARKKEGTLPRTPLPRVRAVSATGHDAFDIIRRELNVPENAPLQVNNFVYQPTPRDKTPHGRPIITRYMLSQGTDVCRVVDFDDASNDLVTEWTRWAKAAKWTPTVVIVPHHGSRYSDIRTLLAAAIRPRSFIITVNPHNQYLHPSAEVLLQCLLAVGRENVHFTGSTANVRISARGVEPVRDADAHRLNFELFVYPQFVRMENRLFQVEEGLLREPGNAELLAKRAELLESLAALRQVRQILTQDKPPPPLARAPAPPPRQPRPGIGGPPKSPNNGGYGERAREVRDQLRRMPPPIGAPSGGPGGNVRRLRGVHPGGGWGGIIVGGEVKSAPQVVSARFLLSANAADVKLAVRVAGDNDDCFFEAMTPTELWAAYQLLKPNNEIKKQGAEQGDVGLVGIKESHKDGSWDFFVHPAIANTLLARQAMRLDMVLALRDLRLRPTPRGWSTYVWYDEPAVISVRNKGIVVNAASGPADLAMRVDLWDRKDRLQFDTLPAVQALHEPFDALQSIDRFSRILAVLSWLEGAKKLPALPERLLPERLNIPARWYFADVLPENMLAIPKDGFKVDGELTKDHPEQTCFVSFSKGKRYVIDMTAADQKMLDPLLGLEDASGKVVAQDDDGGGGLNARIVFRAPDRGPYQIVATAFAGAGRFTLRVKEEE